MEVCEDGLPSELRLMLQKFRSEYPWLRQFVSLPDHILQRFRRSLSDAAVTQGWPAYFAYKVLFENYLLFRLAGPFPTRSEEGNEANTTEEDKEHSSGSGSSEIDVSSLSILVLPRHSGSGAGFTDDFLPVIDPRHLENAAETAKCQDYTGFVLSAEVTPTRIKLQDPDAMLLNRIARHYGDRVSLARIKYCDEDGADINDIEALSSRIDTVFDDGLHLGGRHYKWLGWSNSQMRSKGMWLYHSEGVTALEIRGWVGELEKVLNKDGISKYASRLALAFSSSKDVFDIPESRIGNLKDIERNDFCFTDGGGQITKELAERIAKKLELDHVPCSFQIRFGGAKGVVTINPQLDGTSHDILLRPSQKKFSSLYTRLEILDWAKPAASTLNQQIILLMAACQVNEDAFLEPMKRSLRDAADLVLDEDVAMGFLKRKGFRLEPDAVKKGSKLFNVVHEPLFCQLLQLQYLTDVGKLRKRTAIPVVQGRSLLGIPDDFGVLQEDEVFVQVSALDGGPGERTIVDRDVVVTKNPCLHPGDVRRLRAVNRPDVFAKLGHVCDCIVFPVVGERPLPDQMAGSDLDGDKYFVSWDETLLPPKLFEPMDYSAAAESDEQKAKKEEDKKMRQGLTELALQQYTTQEMREYYKRSCASVGLGVCANAHKVSADKNGADSQDCFRLAQCHSDAVDFPKTGVPATIAPELKPTSYPAFMEKEDKETYHKDTILKKCWEQCPNVNLRRFFVADQGGSSRGRYARRRARRRGKTAEVIDVITPKACFLTEGYEAFERDAREQMAKYNTEVWRIMGTFKVRNEAELFVDLEQQMSMSKKDRLENAQLIRHRMKQLRAQFQRELEAKPERHKRAAAWYYAAYTQEVGERDPSDKMRSRQPLLSFGWIGDKYLIDNLIQSAESSHRHSMAGSEHDPAGVHELIGDSVLECWSQSGIVETLQRLDASLTAWERNHPAYKLAFSGRDGPTMLSPNISTSWVDLHLVLQDKSISLDKDGALEILRTLDDGATAPTTSFIDLPSLGCRVSFEQEGDAVQKCWLFQSLVQATRSACMGRVHGTAACKMLPLVQLLHGWSECVDLGRTERSRRSVHMSDKYMLQVCFLLYLAEQNPVGAPHSLLEVPATRADFLGLVDSVDKSLQSLDSAGDEQAVRELTKYLGEQCCGFLNFMSKQDAPTLARKVSAYCDDAIGCPHRGDRLGELLRERQYEFTEYHAMSTGFFRTSRQIVLDRSVDSMHSKASEGARLMSRRLLLKNVDPIDSQILSLTTRFLRLLKVGDLTSRLVPNASGKQNLQIDVVTSAPAEIRSATELREKLQTLIDRHGSLQAERTNQFRTLASVQQIQNEGVKHFVYQLDTVLDCVRANQVTVLHAPTGSGKTTMLPSALLNENPAELRKILCTQIRRIATVAAAKRSSDLVQELNYRFGKEIGYQIGGDVQSGRDTELLFCIDAIAMMFALQNEAMPFTHIIMDEVHARTVYGDIFLALLKEFHLKKNSSLKLIIMSATAENYKYRDYFSGASQGCKVLELEPPNKFHVAEKYLEDELTLMSAYARAEANRGRYQQIATLSAEDIADFISELHVRPASKNSTILVFLAGAGDIDGVTYFLTEVYAPEGPHKWEVVAMRGGISIEEQERALAARQSDSRLIVLATDVGESSITIPACDIVIDTCLHKRMRQEPGTRQKKLTLEHIAKAEAKQRAGRTGRMANGTVYRLIHRHTYARLPEFPKPEILTWNVADVLLLLQEHLPRFETTISVKAFLTTRLLNTLPMDQIEKGYQDLEEGGAIVSSISGSIANQGVTYLGKLMKELYFDIEYVALVLNGLRLGVVEDAILLVGIFRQGGSPFMRDTYFSAVDRLRLIDVRRACLPAATSDPLTMANAVKAWRAKNIQRWKAKAKQSKKKTTYYNIEPQLVANRSQEDLLAEAQWCWDHYLDVAKLREIDEICVQICDVLKKLGLVPSDFNNTVSRESIDRRAFQAKKAGIRIKNVYADIGNAKREMEELLKPFSSADDEELLLWCLASSFPSSVFSTEGAADNTQVTYMVRDPQKQRRRHRRHGHLTGKERLRYFLESEMRLPIQSIHAEQSKGDTQQVLVTFGSATDANRARQLRDANNYTQMRTDAEVTQRRPCFSMDQRIILPADTACDLSGRHTVVAGSIVATGNAVLCHEISILPPGVSSAILAAVYPSYPNCTFKGHPQPIYDTPVDARVRQLAEAIRKGLDAEFCKSLEQRQPIVKRRRSAVLEIMKHYRSLAERDAVALRLAAARNRKMVDQMQIPSNKLTAVCVARLSGKGVPQSRNFKPCPAVKSSATTARSR
eukprot:TRINITY_DN26559_c0_g1_i2.p1 TRINITY_DN26559_c0_g1~~TRINITY_DN26559_c0_g1_i2.p1  ORF type:complete len:2344 (-),score=429.70 TRINITY_DN26559_c0_g1_i2:331-7272(-)